MSGGVCMCGCVEDQFAIAVRDVLKCAHTVYW